MANCFTNEIQSMATSFENSVRYVLMVNDFVYQLLTKYKNNNNTLGEHGCWPSHGLPYWLRVWLYWVTYGQPIEKLHSLQFCIESASKFKNCNDEHKKHTNE